LLEVFLVDLFRRGVHLAHQFIVVIEQLGQRRIDLFGSQVGMLPEDLFGRLSLVLMLGSQVDHFVSSSLDPSNTISVDRQVGIMARRALDLNRISHLTRPLSSSRVIR
jgi:hypothetical protein